MSGVRWTDADIELLRAQFPHASWRKMKQSFPGRTVGAIRQKAVCLEIVRAINPRVTWLPSEKVILRKLWESAPWPELLEAIPRHNRSAISKQASTMRLHRMEKATRRSRYRLVRELREFRQRKGISNAHLADRIGVHRILLSKWERGEHTPRMALFFDWVESLGLRLEFVRA